MGFRHAVITLVMYALFSATPVSATPQDFEAWLSITSLTNLDSEKRYQFYFETQPRLGNNWQRAATTLVRPGLAYAITRNLSTYLGYAWFPSFYDANYHRDYRDEQRLWQQLLYQHELWGISWQHRLRQEQRKIERTDGVSNRTRYSLRGSYGLTEQNDFGLTAFDEVMVNLNSVDGGPWSGYDRNRLFFGPYWRHANARYEVGYLGEHAKRFGDDERWVHALMVLTSFNF